VGLGARKLLFLPLLLSASRLPPQRGTLGLYVTADAMRAAFNYVAPLA
jgi:hypothetical protein